jgi:hypothetical protein
MIVFSYTNQWNAQQIDEHMYVSQNPDTNCVNYDQINYKYSIHEVKKAHKTTPKNCTNLNNLQRFFTIFIKGL